MKKNLVGHILSSLALNNENNENNYIEFQTIIATAEVCTSRLKWLVQYAHKLETRFSKEIISCFSN